MASVLVLVPTSIAGLCVCTLLLAVAVHVILLLCSRWREDEQLKNMPGPKGHWLLGNAQEIADQESSLGFLSQCAQKYGSPFKVGVGPFRNMVVLSDSACLRTVYSTSDPKIPQVYNMLRPWIGDGLLTSKGKKWARNRRLLTPGFHFEILKSYVCIFNECTRTLMTTWKKSITDTTCLEMFEYLSVLVLECLLRCAFGTDHVSDRINGEDNPYIKAVHVASDLIMDRLQNPLIHNDFLYSITPNAYRFRKACRTMHQYSSTVIQARRRAKEAHQGEALQKRHLDFLDILLEARDQDGEGLTEEEIQHEVDTFMFAGHDTTASALSWFLYNMARNPEHQQRCVDEIQGILGDKKEVTWDDISKFEYLTMCIKESLRLNTTAPVGGRRLTKSVTFPNGQTAPEGVWIMLNIHGLHHDPNIWEDPGKYDPSRFTEENSKDRSPHAYLPFAAGPRNCIGQNFALLEIKTCSALLLKNFKFSVHKEPVKRFQMVLKVANGMWLNVRERE